MVKNNIEVDVKVKCIENGTTQAPKLWLGMTATPDKRDDDIEGKNIYQIFNYQIAYEIRLQQDR